VAEKGNWRSAAAYEYIDDLAPSELAWEFLRRNPDFRAAFREIEATPDAPDRVRALIDKWGLRCPG
jgi:hypothetical protein